MNVRVTVSLKTDPPPFAQAAELIIANSALSGIEQSFAKLIFTITHRRKNYCQQSHFAGGETESQRN